MQQGWQSDNWASKAQHAASAAANFRGYIWDQSNADVEKAQPTTKTRPQAGLRLSQSEVCTEVEINVARAPVITTVFN